ncbi:MAG: prolyl oligopeptidase family serine peptidase [Lachnospiraceae bacterium]|nr:prolyl oligopeptidase family serine peptidase [Lachnospiraceae bacterium]
MTNLRKEIAELIGLSLSWETSDVTYEVLDSVKEEGYTRQLISYVSDEDKVSAYLLLPDHLDNNPAILINHQHNREHHLGKSEVCGLSGNPLQAFGPVLARKGFVVLAPDSICFEERRPDPTVEGFDFWQHFHEMTYRVITGEILMKKVMTDAMNGISLLAGLTFVDTERIGTLGHSYGGNTVLFLTALDERISFACASGSACTYEYRMKHGTGIELASVIPNFHGKYDIDDLVKLTAPRKLFLVSSNEDKYSMDAPEIVKKAVGRYDDLGVPENLEHKRYPGGHALTEERFGDIIDWVVRNC